MSQPLLSMVLIARDEEENIERCLSSWWASVDEVILCDTGSKDRTIEKAEQFAIANGYRKKLKVVHFDWCDDFAKARNYADTHATGEWVVWCDLDDTIDGLDRLRTLLPNATADTVAYFARYDYARDSAGNCLSELWRERVVRNESIEWVGRLHEHKLFSQGTIVKVDPTIAEWVHHADHAQRTSRERNLRILTAWNHDEPHDPRVLSSLGLEHMGLEQQQEAADAFREYLDCPGEPADRRSQAARYRCAMLMMLGQHEQARSEALQAASEHWLWADTHLSLAESAQSLGDPKTAFQHATTALQIGKPDTLLIVNPLQYTAHPKAIMAVCNAQLGRFDDAIKLAGEVLEIAPDYGLITTHLPLWQAHVRRDRTVGAFLSCCELLLEHGEMLKARDLLATVPHYATDDPRVVSARADIARKIGERLRIIPPPAARDAAGEFVLRSLKAAA